MRDKNMCIMFRLIFIVYFSLSCVNTFDLMSSEVTIPQGKLKGYVSSSEAYRRFLKVPYASVAGKFQVPGDPPSWNGTLDVARGSSRCQQYFSFTKTPVGTKDCLVLNIYTPTVSQKTPLPVMVFVHGGGFYWGSNSNLLYNPKHLLEKDVIVVVINYRLGAFGFLCLRNQGAPGNVGLKDQVAALKWIKNNIEHFGGDPNSITLFGESAGAASINYLMVSSLTKGLFHRAIMQSGSIFMPLFDYNPVDTASTVAARLGYNSTDPDELLYIFTKAKEEDVLRASYRDWTNDAVAPYVFGPCLEEPSTDAVITASPKDMYKSSNLSSDITVITGYNDKEGIRWASNYNSQGLQVLLENFDEILPNNLEFPNVKEKNSFIQDVINLYFENKTSTNLQEELVDYFSDTYIMYPSVTSTEDFLRYTNVSVYNYYFRYDSRRNVAKITSKLNKVPGATHGDELFYLFEPIIYWALPTNPQDTQMISSLTSMWASFARNGNPNNLQSPSPTWIKSTMNQLNFLEIDTENRIIPLPNKGRIDFWKNAYKRYGKKYEIDRHSNLGTL